MLTLDAEKRETFVIGHLSLVICHLSLNPGYLKAFSRDE